MAATLDMGLLTTFQHHIDDMRNLAMCKICLKPLYEPFILACGHTYCYGCLRSWFSGLDSRRRKKNCPDCRAEVKFTPAPNYILRDMVHMFIGRAELLPEDETVEEHAAGKKTEADLLANDKEDKGLFQGVFFKASIHPLAALGPIRDYEDGVERCPMCAWEMEDGMCNGCGYDLEEDLQPWSDDEENGLSLMDDENSIASEDVSDGPEYDSENHVEPGFYGARSVADDVDHSVSTATDPYSELDYNTPYDYDEDDMDGFIDDNDGDEPDEVDEVDEDDIDEGPVQYLPRPRARLYRIPDDDEDSSDEEEENENVNQGYHWQPDVTDDEEGDGYDQHDSGQDLHTNYDESDEESRSSTPIAIPIVPRRRNIVVSDDEDEDENESEAEDEDHDPFEDQEDDETLNGLASHTQGGSQSGGVEEERNESSRSANTIQQDPRYLFIEQIRKRQHSPDVWRTIARQRRDDDGERQTAPYQAIFSLQNRLIERLQNQPQNQPENQPQIRLRNRPQIRPHNRPHNRPA